MDKAKAADEKLALRFFRGVGDALAVQDEKLLDPVTGLSGSGPAYVYLFAEALIAGGIKAGLSPTVAERLTFQTLEGAVAMLKETKQSPEELREMVSSPGAQRWPVSNASKPALSPRLSAQQWRRLRVGHANSDEAEERKDKKMFILGNLLQAVASILGSLLWLYFWILVIRIVLSWVNADPYNPIVRFLCSVTDPVLYALRRLLPFPTVIGAIDLTPLLLMLFIQFLQIFLVQSLVDLSLALR